MPVNLEDHKKYLEQLIKTYPNPAGMGMVVPKREGAFYFGRYANIDEYISKYTAEVAALEASELDEELELEYGHAATFEEVDE